jgi:hypothetical protein
MSLQTWWRRRQYIKTLQDGVRKTKAEYEPKLRAGASEKGRYSDDYRRLLAEADHMRSEYSGELQAMQTEALLREARRYLIDVSDIGQPEDGETHWETGPFGHMYLEDHAFLALQKLVHKARREHFKEQRERWAFRFTMTAGIVGLGLTVYNTLVTNQRLADVTGRISALERSAGAEKVVHR